MKIIKSSYKILDELNGNEILSKLELCGRTCYKSENKITKDSSINFVKMILNNGHESVLEHFSFSVKFIFDRGISHEIVRHRLSSFSQESTRYCNYSKDKFDNSLSFINIENHIKNPKSLEIWINHMIDSENRYLELIKLGELPQIARSILPNSLKTEIVVTSNLRQWRTIFKQRTSVMTHPQIREVMIPLLKELQGKIPIIFNDIKYEK